ncbi:hypothetical protein IFM89_022983 [Coptis chinensis]|uniref:F-box associated beta-propeller type 1 domain-containing protein n=1 Tax=Coptis chinensis TaxID=261450 RepID=A0A835IEW7_9MAGN|nr:hypothetical protein IFM89_022983 [Coptis chinensis]
MDSEKIIVKHPYVRIGELGCCNLDFSIISADNFEASAHIDAHIDVSCVLRNMSSEWIAKAPHFNEVLSCCNAVICQQICSGYEHHVWLWNPATKQIRILPESPISLLRRREVTVYVGLVFDVKTDDYKVVKFNFENISYVTKKCRVEIYSLSTDSWRPIDVDLPISYIASDPKIPYRDEIYCWLGGLDDPCLIVSFDIHNEVFQTMSVPDLGQTNPSATLELAILKGQNCLHLLVTLFMGNKKIGT